MRAALLALALLLVAACDGPDEAAAWVAEAAQAHEAADRALDAGRTTAARRHLEVFVHQPVPDSVATEDARVVRQDAWSRLADLALASGDPTRALTLAERGLALGQRRDVFTADLLAAKGRALEALEEPRAAAAALHRALAVTEHLLDQALDPEATP